MSLWEGLDELSKAAPSPVRTTDGKPEPASHVDRDHRVRLHLTLTTRVPETDEIMERHAATAHEDLEKWLAGVTEANNAHRKLRKQQAEASAE